MTNWILREPKGGQSESSLWRDAQIPAKDIDSESPVLSSPGEE